MDLLNNLLQPNAPYKSILVPGAEVDGVMNVTEDDVGEVHEHEEVELVENYGYAHAYQERETKIYREAAERMVREGTGNESMTEITTIRGTLPSEIHRLHQEQSRETYQKYNFDNRRTQELAIDSYREHILNMLNVNEVLIIEGPTGCGKTTQVPQFILDDCKSKNMLCNVIVTQPRRIAAISVAHRVCEERNWGIGSVCGYQVGLEKNTSTDTILHYVTTGVLLQKLVKQKSLNEYTHIIIDEVHERDQDMDFLLLVVRKFLFLQPTSVKVILMSATFDTDEFANYFKNFSGKETIPAPIISIQKPGLYEISITYLDQLTYFKAKMEFAVGKPQIDDNTYGALGFLITSMDRVEINKPRKEGEAIKYGSILVFLPGIYEIEEAFRRLTLTAKGRDPNSEDWQSKWEILPLHSSITVEEQRRAFFPSKPGHRKIILATNIAESSITVPDIDYVIDFCLTKILVIDPITKYHSLLLHWASHVNCVQRAGRVGRISNGKVYRLVPVEFYEQQLPKSIAPEILRAPLDRLVLNSKLLALDEPPEAILSLALNPPDLKNIETTVWSLKECGALTVKCKGKVTRMDGDITFLGIVMAHLPLDVTLSKLIVLGHMFSCLRDTIIMAAGCSLNKVFSTPFQERLRAYTNKLMWADGSCSDLVALMHLYKVWESKKRRNAFIDGTGEKGWLKQNYLSARAMGEWRIMVKEITDRLYRMGIKESVGPQRVVLTQIESNLVLKVVMCGAFYPNYFTRSSDAGQVNEREAVRTLSGRDPYRSVYMTNMRRDQPRQLYSSFIKKYFNCEADISVAFDKSEKVYVQFAMDRTLSTVQMGDQQAVVSVPGRISKEVYKAVRRRQLGMECHIPALPVREAWKRVAQLEKKKEDAAAVAAKEASVTLKSCFDLDERSVIPQFDQEYIQILVTEFIDAGHFWAHHSDDMTRQNLFLLHSFLNAENSKLEDIPEGEKVKIGHLYAAKYTEDNVYYRCKVLHVKPWRRTSVAQVLFIDYGNTQEVNVTNLKCLPELAKLKQPQAMECVLANILPSFILNPRGLWTQEATENVKNRIYGVELWAKVYSVVNNVVHVELYRTQNRDGLTINKWLIEKGYGQYAEESYLSKDNHEKRVAIAASECGRRMEEEEQQDVVVLHGCDIESPDISECNEKINLKGPFSPLEMRVYGITNSSLGKTVKIEHCSVNTVLLDAEPQDPHTRLVVASHIGQNADGTTIHLRNTTLMPNIHGFAALVSLIFCPKMEPKPLPDGSRFASILCGLGAYETTTKALYSPHDFMLPLDTELNSDELARINDLRYWMNETMETMSVMYDNMISPRNEIEDCQQELKRRIFHLLKIKRKSVEKRVVKSASIWNKTLYEGEILVPTKGNDGSEIWPLHWTVQLTPVDEFHQKMKKNVAELSDIARRMTDFYTGAKCEVCDISFVLLSELRVHVISTLHKENVAKNGLA